MGEIGNHREQKPDRVLALGSETKRGKAGDLQ